MLPAQAPGIPAAQPPAVQPPQNPPRFQPLNRCHYLMSTVVNIASIVKFSLLSLATFFGAAACLGCNKKLNATASENGKMLGLSFMAVGLSVWGLLCPNSVNQTLGRTGPAHA